MVSKPHERSVSDHDLFFVSGGRPLVSFLYVFGARRLLCMQMLALSSSFLLISNISKHSSGGGKLSHHHSVYGNGTVSDVLRRAVVPLEFKRYDLLFTVKDFISHHIKSIRKIFLG